MKIVERVISHDSPLWIAWMTFKASPKFLTCRGIAAEFPHRAMHKAFRAGADAASRVVTPHEWADYTSTEAFANSAHWLGNPEHATGSLWAAFVEGWGEFKTND